MIRGYTRILEDLAGTGYEGFVSIEPHISVVFHSAATSARQDPAEKAREQFDSYIEYGRRLEKLLRGEF